MCDVFEETCFSKKKMYTNELNMTLTQGVWTKKTVYQMERNWLSGKEKVPGAAISKNDHHTDSFSGKWKEPFTIDFLEKEASVNSVFYCHLFR